MQIIEGGCYHLDGGLNGQRDPKIPRKFIILRMAVWVVIILILLYRLK